MNLPEYDLLVSTAPRRNLFNYNCQLNILEALREQTPATTITIKLATISYEQVDRSTTTITLFLT